MISELEYKTIPHSPRYPDEVADHPLDVLGLDPFALGGGRETDDRSAAVIPATGQQREAFLQQRQNVQRPNAVHGHRRSGSNLFRPFADRFVSFFFFILRALSLAQC